MGNRSILVTGGAGFIGSALLKKLAENPQNELVAVDNLLTGSQSRLKKTDNIRFIKADVNNYMEIASIFHRFRFDYVFHYAAVVGVKRTLENPVLVLEDLSGIKNILNLCKNTGVKRIFFSSSSEVYGEPVELPQNEHTTPLNSRLPYAIVKNVGEAFLKSYQQEFGLNYTVFRFFNTYGPLQSKDFVVSKFIAAALKNQDILEVADALTDILYVTYGAGHAFGIDLDKCFEEVQQSNMSKLDERGEPIYNKNGKVMKGPNYFKPDLTKFVK